MFNLRIDCTVRGVPKPTVRWFHNDVEFFPTRVEKPRMTTKYELIVEEINEHYTLLVHNLRVKEDAGEYVIRAENELGVTMCKTVLNVERVGPASAPRFIRPLPERTPVQPGSPATLECEVQAEEPVTFQWYVNGIEIPRTAKEFVIEEDTTRKVSSLTIPIVKPEMVPGDVLVQATAPDGASVVSTSILEMQATSQEYLPPATKPLRFIQPLQPVLVPQTGEDVSMIAVVDSIHRPRSIGLSAAQRRLRSVKLSHWLTKNTQHTQSPNSPSTSSAPYPMLEPQFRQWLAHQQKSSSPPVN